MAIWDCQVMDVETRSVSTEPYTAAWSPEKDFVTPESVANACAAELSVSQRRKFSGVAAILRESSAGAS